MGDINKTRLTLVSIHVKHMKCKEERKMPLTEWHGVDQWIFAVNEVKYSRNHSLYWWYDTWKSNDKKKDKQESTSTIPEEVQEFVNLTITEHMGKAYSEWKLNQDKEPVSEIEKKYQELLETLSPEPVSYTHLTLPTN